MTGHRHSPTRWRRWVALGAALIVTALSAPIAAQPAGAAGYVPISGSGSTWSFNAIDAWRKNVVQYGMDVSYAAKGSTTGRNEFKNGSVDWAASDIPYGVKDGTNDDPPPTRGYAYMPDTAGGTTFMYNLKIGTTRVTNLRLSGPVIAGIFTGTITNWSDPRIKKDNPGLTLPAIRIVPVVRSDGSGATAQFTQWMLATQPSAWRAYCGKVGRNPCTQTSAYPVLSGSGMVAQSGDLGVSGYVSQAQAVGAIGYVEYSYALNTGFPVAKVLNSAGYYTEPTPGHVAVSLLDAKINNDASDLSVYLTQDLSAVYTDTDPRTYPLSSYSYMILPTTTANGFNTTKGFTLGDFGKYLLCQGQQQVDALGYSALPINLVQAGFTQLKHIPGAQIQNINIQSCNNPTFSTDGTNTLAKNDPFPQSCDHVGLTQCATGTGGAKHQSTPTHNPAGAKGSSGSGNGPAGTTANGPGGTAKGAAGGANGNGTAAAGANGGNGGQNGACDPDSGTCDTGGAASLAANEQPAIPVASPAGLGDGMQVTLMVLAAVILIAVGLVPPLIAQAALRKRNGNQGGGDR